MPTQTINLNNTIPGAPIAAVNVEWQADAPNIDPTVARNVSAFLPAAAAGKLGVVRPDNKTIKASAAGDSTPSPAFVQSIHVLANVASFASPVTEGNLIVVIVGGAGTPPSTVVDNFISSYVQRAAGGGNVVFVGYAASSGPCTVTWAIPVSSDGLHTPLFVNYSTVLLEFSGASNAVDVVSAVTSPTVNESTYAGTASCELTTTQPGDAVIVIASLTFAGGASGGVEAPSGYTVAEVITPVWTLGLVTTAANPATICYQIAPAGTLNPSVTTSANSGVGGAMFALALFSQATQGGLPAQFAGALYAPVMVGDTGSGGTAGLVPAPDAGDAAAGKFLSANGSFEVPAGGSGGTALYFMQGDAAAIGGETTITLSPAPLAGSLSIYVGGSILRFSTGFSLAGSIATLAAALSTGQVVCCSWVSSSAGSSSLLLSGGSSTSHPIVRGAGMVAQSSSNYTLPLPSGTLAGDLALVFGGQGWSFANPSGWTVLDNSAGAWWNGACWSKILDSGDISAGSVTVSALGSFDGATGIITFVGATGGVRETIVDRSSDNSTTVALTTGSDVVASDTAVYWGSGRLAAPVSVNRGTMSAQTNDGASASGCIYTEEMTAAGAVTASFSYGGAPSGHYEVVIVVKES